MLSKILNYLNKVFFKYLVLITIVFILTIIFSKSKTPIFLNLSAPNNSKEIKELLNNYLISKKEDTKKEILKKLIDKETFLLPELFHHIKNDSSNKTEYIQLLDQLNIIKSCKNYNIDCYISEWDKIKEKYTKAYINDKLKTWFVNKDKRLEIEENLKQIGKFANPEILNFLVTNKQIPYLQTKPLYKLLNNITGKKIFSDELFEDKQLIKEYFNFYHAKHSFYYEEFTLSNQLKTILTDTQFSNWFRSALSFNFGTINQISIYQSISTVFLRTLIITLLLILISYYFTIILVLKIKRKSNIIYKIINKTLYSLSLIPPLMIIIVLAIFNNILNLTDKDRFTQYIIFLFTITLLVIFKTIEGIILRERNKKGIFALRFYGIKESIIFKKYVYKNINIHLLRKIKSLILTISSYILVFEYLLDFNGLGKLLINSLIKTNFELIRVNLLFIGITIFIIRTSIDIIIFANLKEINKDETNN
jgi:peptide/nickel transport system permease protein